MSSPLLVGVHQPGDSWLHRCPTGVKLLGLAAFSLTVVLTRSAAAAPVFLGLALLAAAVGGERLATLGRATRAILVLAVMAAGFQWWIDGPAKAVETLVDLVALALAAITVSATTPVNAMLDTLVRAARPLRVVGVDPERVALTIRGPCPRPGAQPAGLPDAVRGAGRRPGARAGRRTRRPGARGLTAGDGGGR